MSSLLFIFSFPLQPLAAFHHEVLDASLACYWVAMGKPKGVTQRISEHLFHMFRHITRRAFSISIEEIAAIQRGPPRVFQVGKLDHVAIAVPDLAAATAFYRDTLGAQVSEPQDSELDGVTTVFVNLPNTKFELLHPYGENSPIENFLQKNPSGGIHHVCLEVECIYQAMDQVKKMGVRVLGEIGIGAHGKPVIFLHPKDCNGVLVELEQEFFWE